MRILLSIVAVFAVAFFAWQVVHEEDDAAQYSESPAADADPLTPRPLAAEHAYEAAAAVSLEPRNPEPHPGLQNVFRLSDRIISGSEPHGEPAFRALQAMGVKTILSVDGSAPEVELARRHGLRYVHVPIQYRGVTDDELLHIAKTFRELEPPFYVHCFHGKHRGPTAAAIGRLTLDGVSRERALAEMRQWCGTSRVYDGLYRDVASRPLPTPEQSSACRWDFPPREELKGFRHAMIEIVRVADRLHDLAARGWVADPAHPDVDAVNEAAKLADLFARAAALESVGKRPEDIRRRIAESAEWSRELLRRLESLKGGDGAAREQADAAHEQVRARCDACHKAYRND